MVLNVKSRWLKSLFFYGGWGVKEAMYIQFLSVQAWTPSLSTDGKLLYSYSTLSLY
jgi:hypothetical protein